MRLARLSERRQPRLGLPHARHCDVVGFGGNESHFLVLADADARLRPFDSPAADALPGRNPLSLVLDVRYNVHRFAESLRWSFRGRRVAGSRPRGERAKPAARRDEQNGFRAA